MNIFNSRKGFTLIELMVVIVIIGILATLGLVSFQNALKRSRNAKASSDLKDIASAQEQFRALKGIAGTYVQLGSTSGQTCTATTIDDFSVPTSASSNNYTCYQAAGGGSFCMSVLLEGANDGNCGGCSDATTYDGSLKTHFCVKSKQ